MDLGKLTDKAKDLLNKNEDKVEQGLDQAAGLIDDKTGHKHTDKIDTAVDKLKDVIGEPNQP